MARSPLIVLRFDLISEVSVG